MADVEFRPLSEVFFAEAVQLGAHGAKSMLSAAMDKGVAGLAISGLALALAADWTHVRITWKEQGGKLGMALVPLANVKQLKP